MLNNKTVWTTIAIIGCMFGVAHCQDHTSAADTAQAKAKTAVKKPALTAEGFIRVNRGKVIVMLMGMPTCPGTRKSTLILAKYAKTKPDGVVIARVDTPPPNKSIKPEINWQQHYAYFHDAGRTLAKRLDFFFYPTLYIMDKDGEVRFYGKCELEKISTIAKKLLTEKPGTPKKMFSPLLLKIGIKAPDFKAKTILGQDSSLARVKGKSATLLVFVAASCPFCMKAMSTIKVTSQAFADQGLSIVVIARDEPLPKIRAAFIRHNPAVPILLDDGGGIFKAYSMGPVPFFFLLDSDNKVIARQPLTSNNLIAALKPILGSTATAKTHEGAGCEDGG